MKWLAGQKYCWSFRLNGYNAQMTSLSFGQSNDDVRCSIDSDWKNLERHASLLKTLAEHENVDPLTAYPDHIAALKVGGDNFVKTAETMPFDRWKNALNGM
jgi:hypothetical protein